MVNIQTTRSFRQSRQATVNWVTRAVTAALHSRDATQTLEETTDFMLDGVLQPDLEHPNWWVSPVEEDKGPLFYRELPEDKPRWINAANKAGFFAGLRAWQLSRCEELNEEFPDHTFKVRYELDSANGNRYQRTVLQVSKGREPDSYEPAPAMTIAPIGSGRGRGQGRGQGRGRGREDSSGREDGDGYGQGRGRVQDRGDGSGRVQGRGRGRGDGSGGRGGRGRGEGGSGRGGPYRPANRDQPQRESNPSSTVDLNNWASKVRNGPTVPV